MKSNYYVLANNSPPVNLSIVADYVRSGYAWGNAVALGITGILLALSIIAYLFKKN
jgi:hypothetical protein